MSIAEDAPIACSLSAGAYKDRLSWIAALNRDALRSYVRRDLVLDLSYAAEARARVHELVRNEQACCGFLDFNLYDTGSEIRVTVTVPEAAREAADALLEKFTAKAPASSPCACVAAPRTSSKEPAGSKAEGVTAMTLSTGAIACDACCVLSFALPATVLSGTGSLLAWFVSMHRWVTMLAILSVIGAWAWIAWQSHRTRRRAATSTLIMMAVSTVLLSIAVLWPLLEKPLIRMLRA